MTNNENSASQADEMCETNLVEPSSSESTQEGNDSIPSEIKVKSSNNPEEEPKIVMSIRELMAITSKEPPREFIFPGIARGSFGFIFGPSKSGKTILCENLLMSIAAGQKQFLGHQLPQKGEKVLMISLEEFYVARTERNSKQIARLAKSIDYDDWIDNYKVVSNAMPRFFHSAKEWGILDRIIGETQAPTVIIDSGTRIFSGAIEESKVAKDATEKLRELTHKHGITLGVIHHSSKSEGPLSLNTMAGSRVLGQEADFILGINRTPKGDRYLKPVAFRYASDDHDKVTTFKINDDCWIEQGKLEVEEKLFILSDGRIDDTNRRLILEFMDVQKTEVKPSISSKELIKEFVDTKRMSRQTLFDSLRTLSSEGLINREEKGSYSFTQVAA